MGEYRKINLKGLEDLNDSKFSLQRLALSENAKIAVEVNRELNGFKPMQEAQQIDRIENPEKYSKIASAGGKVQGDINAENGHMQRIQKKGASLGGIASGKNKTTKRLQLEKEFYDQLPETHSTKDSDRVALSMGKSTAWGRRIIRKLGTKIKFTGSETIYKKDV